MSRAPRSSLVLPLGEDSDRATLSPESQHRQELRYHNRQNRPPAVWVRQNGQSVETYLDAMAEWALSTRNLH